MEIICQIFAYNRPDLLERLLSSIDNNLRREELKYFIRVDGVKSSSDKVKVRRTLEIARRWAEISGLNVEVLECSKNLGLKQSIVDQLNYVAGISDSFIVLEDDLILDYRFFDYHLMMLDKFKEKKEVISISGFSPIRLESLEYGYYGQRTNSWGWSTWSDRWRLVSFKRKNLLKSTFKLRTLASIIKWTPDLLGMVINSFLGRINSWSIHFSIYALEKGLLTIYPNGSLVKNIGVGSEATHTSKIRYAPDRVDTEISNSLIRNLGTQESSKFKAYYLR